MGYLYWVASYPKSGNTWMRAFLANLIAGERGVDINQLRQVLPDENLGSFHRPVLTVPIETATVEQLAVARPLAHRRLASHVNGFMFLKTHTALQLQFGQPAIDPGVTAGALYIIRNPLDVVVSYARFRNWSIDQSIAAINDADRMLPRAPGHSFVVTGSWSQHVSSWTERPHDRMLVLRYEDMLATPEMAFGRIVDFLKIAASADDVSRAIARSSFEQLQSAEQRSGFAERPIVTKQFFREGRSEQWRAVLSDHQARAIASANATQMKRFGYWDASFDL